MKRVLMRTFVLVMAICMTACPTLAAGKLVVGQENFHVTDSFNLYGYAYARVENTGDRPVEFSAGLLEIYNADGDTLTSSDYLHCYPSCLEPGEIGYVYAYDTIDTAESVSEVDDYLLTVTGKSSDSKVTRYPAVASYQKDVQITKYSTYDYVVAEITNDSEETVYSMEVVIALLDDNDNLLYMAYNNFYNSTGINAGSTITYRDSISDTWYDTWAREGLTPTHAEVIAYSEVSDF